MSNIGYLVIDGIINPITNILSHTQSNLIPNSDTQLYFLAILPSNKSVKANIINSIIANLILFDNRVGIIIIGDIPLVSVNKFGICFFIHIKNPDISVVKTLLFLINCDYDRFLVFLPIWLNPV